MVDRGAAEQGVRLIADLVGAGIGVSILPETAVAPDHAGVRLRVLLLALEELHRASVDRSRSGREEIEVVHRCHGNHASG